MSDGKVTSQLTNWWHNFVNNLNIDANTKNLLNTYGMFGIWALMIGLPILAIVIIAVIIMNNQSKA